MDFFENRPDWVLSLLSCAASNCFFKNRSDANKDGRFRITARIINFGELHSLNDLKSNAVDKYYVIRGTVIRIGAIKPLVLSMEYQCKRCSAKATFEFIEGKIEPITQCPSNNRQCKARNPRPICSSAQCVDYQRIRLQELSGDDNGGRIPKHIDIELTRDLVDECMPGDVVTIGGIVRATKCESNNHRQTLYQLYIDANSVQRGMSKKNKNDFVEFVQNDFDFILNLVNEQNLFRLIVNSLCPSIYGHEIVKAGLLLAVIGGNTNSNEFIRGDIHMLIVGDPGLGKSQLLRSIARIAPRGVYVSGNTTSIAGLTVTMVREQGDLALEAGALVMADEGVCCIDEFDKMGNQHTALLEAMEQQSISIAKSGMLCTLSARTTVIAAANPCGGHYDFSKTIPENIKMSAPLLSRFDLLFLLLDKEDSDFDTRLASHIMDLSQFAYKSKARVRDTKQIGPSNNESSLQSRLQIAIGDKCAYDLIPERLLKKYIVYARKYCHPQMTASAKKVLLCFYLSLRAEHQKEDSTPITTRQLESLIRLTQARAKLELRQVVTEQDAKDVVEIMKASIYDVCVNDVGKIDFKRAKGASMVQLQSDFGKLMMCVCKDQRKNTFKENEIKQILAQNNFPPNKIDKLFQLVTMHGTLTWKTSIMRYEFGAGREFNATPTATPRKYTSSFASNQKDQ